MNSPATSTAGTNGESSVQDLFALSDEQILEIEPEAQDSEVSRGLRPVSREETALREARVPDPTARDSQNQSVTSEHDSTQAGDGSRATSYVGAEPPAWLAAQMKDPWNGEEAKELWNGVQQARQEAAAYRATFANPEDARALKELYPGGVSEARAAAERGRLLEEIDRTYFGAAGNSPEQLIASRAQLAQRMLREDPAAFREMVVAGLQALQEAEQGSGPPNEVSLPRLGQVFAESRSDRGVASRLGIGTSSAAGSQQTPSDAGPFEAQGKLKPGATSPSSGAVAQQAAPLRGNASSSDAHVAAYAAFERAANEDLERSVGGAIERTLAQALPSLEQHNTSGQGRHGEQAGAQRAAPLRERLAQAVRQDIEKALQGDRQLGEQVAQILAARRFDNDTRAHIVRLIADRVQQLVPGAAKRVLNDWTQTTLAAHRGRTQRADSASSRADVALVYPEVSGRASVPAHPVGSEKASTRRQDAPRNSGQASATNSRPINYRKLSDEQILEM